MTETVDLKGAAEYLHVSVSVMARMADAGEVPGAKVAQRWVFLVSDLRSYLSALAAEQTAKRRDSIAPVDPTTNTRGKPKSAYGVLQEAKRKRRAPLPDLARAEAGAT